MNESEIEIQATDIPEVNVETAVEEQEQPKGRRSSLMAAVRSRSYNSDLTRAHVALMEREVVLPQKQLELFRLVNRHYRTLQAWHDQYTGGVSNAAALLFAWCGISALPRPATSTSA